MSAIDKRTFYRCFLLTHKEKNVWFTLGPCTVDLFCSHLTPTFRSFLLPLPTEKKTFSSCKFFKKLTQMREYSKFTHIFFFSLFRSFWLLAYCFLYLNVWVFFLSNYKIQIASENWMEKKREDEKKVHNHFYRNTKYAQQYASRTFRCKRKKNRATTTTKKERIRIKSRKE